ncbi:hypothetical protein LOTGIDRAFT_176715, partial [Lottia gigantea]
HFSEIIEDQFDFHTYCMRKMTLRAYVELLQLEDKLRMHPFYVKAAHIAIEIYLHLHDHPWTPESEQNNDLDSENLSAAELRKLKRKQKKKERKAEEEREKQLAEQKRKDQQSKKSQDNDLDGPKEEELIPEELAKTDNPLECAIKFLKPLQLLNPNLIGTHVVAYEIYSRKGKLLLMLQSVKRGYQLNKDDPHFHVCFIKFLLHVKGVKDLDGGVKTVIEQEVNKLTENKPINKINQEFLDRNSSSLPHYFA